MRKLKNNKQNKIYFVLREIKSLFIEDYLQFSSLYSIFIYTSRNSNFYVEHLVVKKTNTKHRKERKRASNQID